jgi:hypothetical protein
MDKACRSSGSLTFTTLHSWRFDELAADCAAATSISSVPVSSRLGR